MANLKTTIGTRATGVFVVSTVTGAAQPFTVTVLTSAELATTVTGDVFTDFSGRTYRVTDITGAIFACENFGQTGTPPITGTGNTTRAYSTVTSWEADLDDTIIHNTGGTAIGIIYDD